MTIATALAACSGAVALAGGVGAIGARRLMRAVASLTLLFLGLAGLFGALGATYLAIAQVFLFVGGVVALLALAFSSSAVPAIRGASLTTVGVALLGLLVAAAALPAIPDAAASVQLHDVALALFARYGPALEIALLIILSAVIGVGALLADEPEAKR